MAHPDFPQVQDFPDLPRPGAALSRTLWATLFFTDFTFGLTSKPDSEGDVVRKSQYPGMTGRLYRSVYARLARDLEEQMAGTDFSQPMPVPWVDAKDWKRADFDRWRRTENAPLVIKGMLKDTHAVRTWSLEWLAEKYGDVRVRTLDLSKRHLIEGKLTTSENVALAEMTMREFCTEDRYEEHYINNYHGLFTDREFHKDCGGSKVETLRGLKHVLAQWFISRSERTFTELHAANGDNLFMNLKGKKEWHFIHPMYTAFLMPALGKFAVYTVSEAGNFGPDTYEQRYAQYPYLKALPKLVCTLEEGDVLYNPPWWWHNVQNRTPFNIACATRYPSRARSNANVPVFLLCQLVDMVKHPRKSFFPASIRAALNKGERKNFIDSVFTRPMDDEKVQERLKKAEDTRPK